MDVTVDQMRLRLPGTDADAAVRLAQLVAERLAAPLALLPGETAMERLDVKLIGVPGESPDSLAGRIAAEVILRLAEHPLEAGR